MSCIDRVAQLKSLHLYGMATAWGELQTEKPRHLPAPETWLDRLLEAEQADLGRCAACATSSKRPSFRSIAI